MSTATYTFLPWLRRGLGGMISGSTGMRATINVGLDISGEPVSGSVPLTAHVQKSVEMFGPGDVTGIDMRAIVRTEPRSRVANFEPNYLACIEFYEEDFPWRYSPASPNNNNLRLQPWLALIVLAENEFEPLNAKGGRPAAFVTVTDLNLLPPTPQLWAWAHVHVDNDVSGNVDEFVSPNMAAVLPKLDQMLKANADTGYSRIVCPRRLKPSTAYRAFLVPTFEAGRLAGLGLPLDGISSATDPAWGGPAGRPQANSLPYYHQWEFNTGKAGDFEDLVRLLKPKTLKPPIGTRPIDVQRPGSNLATIMSGSPAGILLFGGALQLPLAASAPGTAPTEAEKTEAWDDDPSPHAFQTGLAHFINLADDYQIKPADQAQTAAGEPGFSGGIKTDDEAGDLKSPDPVIAPPLYGRFHAAVDRLLEERDGSAVGNVGNWIHELNLDPRFRVAASSGTKVIQKEQEEHMRAAWAQVGEVIEANRKMKLNRYAREVSGTLYKKRLLGTVGHEDRFLRLTRPVHKRVISKGRTMKALLGESGLTSAFMSGVATRVLRPGGRLIRHMSVKATLDLDKLTQRLNDGKITIAPPKALAKGLLSVNEIAKTGIRKQVSQPRFPREQKEQAKLLAQILSLEEVDVSAFDRVKKPERFVITDPDDRREQPADAAKEDGIRLIQASREWHNLVTAGAAASKRPEAVPLNMKSAKEALSTALNPEVALKARLFGTLQIPPWIKDALEEDFDEIMHHPVIDTPMYKPLEALSQEFLLPGLNKIPPDSISVVETNQRFIESYMVGLNHEMSRELLWREYPTDQRGSVFRQFWDVSGAIMPGNANVEVFRESLRDIPKIHEWKNASKLGSHDNREQDGNQESEVVLVVRGELLKKYPNTIIYAQRAEWKMKNGQPDFTKERVLVEISEAEFANPPPGKLKFPLYEAKVRPDIYFFGFDLTPSQAKGGDATASDPDPGWFFVLRERPGEPRFGFDTEPSESKIYTYNDVAWPHVIPPGASSDTIDPMRSIALATDALPDSLGEKAAQQKDDRKVQPADISSARWAYLLYQAPVMVAVHAAEMLKGL